jgi:hypothetical protein
MAEQGVAVVLEGAEELARVLGMVVEKLLEMVGVEQEVVVEVHFQIMAQSSCAAIAAEVEMVSTEGQVGGYDRTVVLGIAVVEE